MDKEYEEDTLFQQILDWYAIVSALELEFTTHSLQPPAEAPGNAGKFAGSQDEAINERVASKPAFSDTITPSGRSPIVASRRKANKPQVQHDHLFPKTLWTKDQHESFLKFAERYGRSAHKKIAEAMGNMTPQQVASHSQKFFIKLAKAPSAREITPDQFQDIVNRFIQPTIAGYGVEMKPVSFRDKKQVSLCARIAGLREATESDQITSLFIQENSNIIRCIKMHFAIMKAK